VCHVFLVLSLYCIFLGFSLYCMVVSRPARPRYIPYAITFWGVEGLRVCVVDGGVCMCMTVSCITRGGHVNSIGAMMCVAAIV
jgi:hypothetical protein